jgi:O-antigen/teichoic acid export membrane protein
LHETSPSPADAPADRAAGEPGARAGRRGANKAVVRDAGLLMVGDVFDRGLGFAFLLAATKLYGLEIYGTYQLALAAFQVVRTVVSFGLGRSIVRDTAAAAASDDMGRVKGAIAVGLGISCTLAVALGAALVFLAPDVIARFYPTHPEVIAPLRVFGYLTPLFAINFIFLQAFYGLDRIRTMVVANNVVEPITRLATLVGLFAAGVLGLRALPWSYLVALVVSSVFAITVFAREFWPRLAGAHAVYRLRETLAFTIPVTLNDLASRSFRSFIVFLLAPFLTSAELGIFGVALKLTGVVFFFSGSLTAAFRPRISRLIAQQRMHALELETRAYNRWILTFALLPYGLLILFPEPILGVLGSQYLPVAGPLRVFCVGLLVAQASGPLMALLLMSGRSRAPLVFLVIAGTLFAGLALWVTPKHGVMGASIAAAATMFTFVPILSAYTQLALGIRIYGRATWKPIAAGIVAFAVGYAVSLVTPEVRFLDAFLIGGSTTLVYVVALVRLGAEPDERALLVELLGPLAKVGKKVKKLLR